VDLYIYILQWYALLALICGLVVFQMQVDFIYTYTSVHVHMYFHTCIQWMYEYIYVQWYLAFTWYCHDQYCIVYGLLKGGRTGVVYCAIAVQ